MSSTSCCETEFIRIRTLLRYPLTVVLTVWPHKWSHFQSHVWSITSHWIREKEPSHRSNWPYIPTVFAPVPPVGSTGSALNTMAKSTCYLLIWNRTSSNAFLCSSATSLLSSLGKVRHVVRYEAKSIRTNIVGVQDK